MDWILQHWQTIAAGAIVAVSAGLLLRRALRRRGGKSCGSDCGCDVRKPGSHR